MVLRDWKILQISDKKIGYKIRKYAYLDENEVTNGTSEVPLLNQPTAPKI